MIKTPHAFAGLFLCSSAVVSADHVVLSEIMYNPGDATKPEFIEVWNPTKTPFDMAAWRLTDGVEFTFPEFSAADAQASFFKTRERIVISEASPEATRTAWNIPIGVRIFGPWTGSLDNAGETITLVDKNGTRVSSVEYRDAGRKGSPAADGAGHSLVLIDPFKEIDDYRNWRSSPLTGGDPGQAYPPEPVAGEVFGLQTPWRFTIPTSDPGTGFRALDFDDSTWSEGASPIGFDTTALPVALPPYGTRIDPAPPGPRSTMLFRKKFTVAESFTAATLSIDQIVDDGVVYYLNGEEIGRSRVAAGAAWDGVATLHEASLENDIVANKVVTTTLKQGENVLVAEVHNQTSADTDITFAARLRLSLARPPRPLTPTTAVINEIHFDAQNAVAWVELANPAHVPADLAGLFLSSRQNFGNRIALSGSIPAQGYRSFDTNFANTGDPVDFTDSIQLFITDAAGNVLSSVAVNRKPGNTLQAVPLGANEWYGATTTTRDALNSPPRQTAIVINEIMLDPPSDVRQGEFIELFNRSDLAINLGGWQLDEAVEFVFPAGTTIAPRGYLVIGADAAWLTANYPGLVAIGNWSGALSNNSDDIRLIDAEGNLADSVHYRLGGAWPDNCGGDGSSLELVHPDVDNSLPSAWRDSDESQKSSFQPFSVSGLYVAPPSTPGGSETGVDEIHLHLVGDSHALLRNVAVKLDNTGNNLLNNADKLSTNGQGTTGWLCQGTHHAQYKETNGYTHAGSFFDAQGGFHLIADGHGDNRANRAEIDCTALVRSTTAAPKNYTISFEARWVSGANRLICQTWDHSIGKAFELPIPNHLGTPGAANSRLAAAVPAQVDGGRHSPAVPKTTDVVTVTARVASASGIQSVELLHRQDSNTTYNGAWSTKPMTDDGAGADAVAGDGVYSASLTEYAVDSRIGHFYVKATGLNGSEGVFPRQGAAQPAMFVTDNTVISTELRRQRFVVSAYHLASFNTGDAPLAAYGYNYPRLSNHYFPCTFIHDEKEIVYGAGIRKTGSPWTRSGDGTLSRARWQLPSDSALRGRTKFTYDNDGAGGQASQFLHNRICRYWLYLFNHAAGRGEFVYVIRNGDNPTVREDTEPIDPTMVDRFYENGGDLGMVLRSDDEWWFDDSWGRTNRNADWSYKNTEEPTRYHTEWMMRSREKDYDYSSFTSMVRTLKEGFTEEEIGRLMDADRLCAMTAMRGYIQDWDSITLDRGKNGFMYRQPDGRWILMHWDSDLAFGSATGSVLGSLPGIRTYFDKPFIRKRLNYYLTEMLNKYTKNSARVLGWLDAEEAASTAYTAGKSFYSGWFTNRETTVRNEINNATGGASGSYTKPFALTSPPTTTAEATINLTGDAPSSAYTVIAEGHPEAVCSWTNKVVWVLNGIRLATGANTLTLRTLDRDGNVINTVTHTVTKSGYAAPNVVLTAQPASWNVALGELMVLDASSSSDPDGGPLTYDWTLPSSGGDFAQADVTSVSAVFYKPGVYSFTVSATDAQSATTSVTREVVVFASRDFSTFGTPVLDSNLSLMNTEVRDNHSANSWVSLEDSSGRLFLQLLNTAAQPLAFSSPTYPVVHRDLPDSTDWTLETEVTLLTRQFGSFHAGLWLAMTEDGQPVQYAFGLDGGKRIAVKRISEAGVVTVATTASTRNVATLRIRRVGNQLLFERRLDGVWTEIGAQAIPAGAVAGTGGLFAATTAAEGFRFAFDYLLVADPTLVNPVLAGLRLTEIMYHPAGTGVEYLELQNISAQPITLTGANFTEGQPFAAYTFADAVVNPQEFVILTENAAEFKTQYGNGPRVLGAWSPGNLNNGGEGIVLKDPQGNSIHDFSYESAPPWPTEPDGLGPSLEVIDVNGDYDDPANWRASFEPFGSPGSAGLGRDSDGDGQSDGVEGLFGTDPQRANSHASLLASVAADGSVSLTTPSAVGRSYRFERTSDFLTWSPLQTVIAISSTTSFTDTTATPATDSFYRVVALP